MHKTLNLELLEDRLGPSTLGQLVPLLVTQPFQAEVSAVVNASAQMQADYHTGLTAITQSNTSLATAAFLKASQDYGKVVGAEAQVETQFGTDRLWILAGAFAGQFDADDFTNLITAWQSLQQGQVQAQAFLHTADTLWVQPFPGNYVFAGIAGDISLSVAAQA